VKIKESRNINSDSEDTSSSSSGEEEDCGKQKENNGLCCVTSKSPRSYCVMGRSFGSKKSDKDDSDSDCEDEVSHDPDVLLKEIARLNDLLDNCDDVLRKANEEKREYRSLLGEAKENVAERESLLVDARV
jgi:hypothetical protein